MAVQVYLVKRKSRKTGRNGKPRHRYSMRWRDPTTGQLRSESCATGDGVQADALLKLKWAELNGLAESTDTAPVVETKLPTWDECDAAARKAMKADNLRSSTVSDFIGLFNGLRRMFPQLDSPALLTFDMANDYKRRRSEHVGSPWTVRGDLSALSSLFGKWLKRECGLLASNPFEDVKPPRCDEPDIRIVSAKESSMLFDWLGERWNHWKIPVVYLQVASIVGWRATEIASMRSEDLLADGFVRVASASSKTRKHKHGWLPDVLYRELVECGANGFAFGKFSDELRRLLFLWKKRPNHAARVKDFTPKRLVGWMQDELKRFNEEQARKAENDETAWDSFTLHDFRRTAITGLQMSGASEKEASVMVGATPEVIRRHYEKMDQQRIARRIVEQRLSGDENAQSIQLHRSLRKSSAQAKQEVLDDQQNATQTVSA